jgi:hypothetical protein
MVNKIIFLDLDGPMIPGRSYLNGPGDNRDLVLAGMYNKFDPLAVAMINDVCEHKGWRLVLHTSWVRHIGGKLTQNHCIEEGIKPEYFHENAWCDENENWRYTRVARWLEGHPEVTDYVIIDDSPYNADIMSGYPHPEDMERHLMLVSYEDGLLSEHYNKLRGI